MTERVGVVGGTTLRSLGDHDLRVDTPWGPADLTWGALDGLEVAFLERHAVGGDRVPPHQVPHRRNVHALACAGVGHVVAVHTVGALDPDLEQGTLAAPGGFVDATGEPPTFHDGDPVHVAMDPPFCPRVRQALLDRDEVVPAGPYVQTSGPRLETPDEVEVLRGAGDLVGMTAAAEATLARERGLCYASLAVVANRAPGLGDAVHAEGVAAAVRERGDEVRAVVEAAAGDVPGGSCPCPDAPRRGRLD